MRRVAQFGPPYLMPFVQFKKHEKLARRSDTFSDACDASMGAFHVFKMVQTWNYNRTGITCQKIPCYMRDSACR